ncbi:erythromycin esterase family protein [Puia dinghuensis]|nr:erythromycin esterase family protein [Puia dinghuensis]
MQKMFVFLFVLCFAVAARAQDLAASLRHCTSSVRSIAPDDSDYSDLNGLRAAIGGARIVLLGEQTHGEGSTFGAKIRLIKFLHEKMGFDVLAFESGFYDCARIWENVEQGGALSQEVIGSLFYMYATSVQMQPLFDYVQSEWHGGQSGADGGQPGLHGQPGANGRQGGLHGAQPLVLTGFESQHTGVKAKTQLFDDFERFMRKQQPAALDEEWDLFRRVSIATFASRDYRPSLVERSRFFAKLTALQRLLNEDGKVTDSLTSSMGFWYQVLNSIESQTTRYWQMVTGNEVSVRDLQMAKNLIWLAEKAYPGKKIIVWAHNGHVAKGMSSLVTGSQPPPKGEDAFVPMGATIHHYFGSRAYCIGFSGSEGSYMNYVNDQIVNVAARPAGSIEGTLAGAGYTYAFVDYRRATGPLRQLQQATLADYGEARGIWPEVFDGLFFIAKVSPVERTGK